MKVIVPPQPIPSEDIDKGVPSIFLGGSIEMGTAELWQDKVIRQLVAKGVDGIVLNPRRPDWDISWEQSPSNHHFKEQVDWEIQALQQSGLAAFYFDPNTKAPITLFELGLAAGSQQTSVVYCPDGFWRKGNVDIYCQRFGIQQVTSHDEFIYEIGRYLNSATSK